MLLTHPAQEDGDGDEGPGFEPPELVFPAIDLLQGPDKHLRAPERQGIFPVHELPPFSQLGQVEPASRCNWANETKPEAPSAAPRSVNGANSDQRVAKEIWSSGL